MCLSKIWHAWKCFLWLSQELQFEELPGPSQVLRQWYTAMEDVFIQNWPFAMTWQAWKWGWDWEFYFGLWLLNVIWRYIVVPLLYWNTCRERVKRMHDGNPIFLYLDLASEGSIKLLWGTFAVNRVQDGCWLIRTSSALKVTHMTSIFFWEKELNY